MTALTNESSPFKSANDHASEFYQQDARDLSDSVKIPTSNNKRKSYNSEDKPIPLLSQTSELSVGFARRLAQSPCSDLLVNSVSGDRPIGGVSKRLSDGAVKLDKTEQGFRSPQVTQPVGRDTEFEESEIVSLPRAPKDEFKQEGGKRGDEKDFGTPPSAYSPRELCSDFLRGTLCLAALFDFFLFAQESPGNAVSSKKIPASLLQLDKSTRSKSSTTRFNFKLLTRRLVVLLLTAPSVEGLEGLWGRV